MGAHVNDRPGKARIAHLRHRHQKLARERTHHAPRCAPSDHRAHFLSDPAPCALIITVALRPCAQKTRRPGPVCQSGRRCAIALSPLLSGSICTAYWRDVPMTIKVGDKAAVGDAQVGNPGGAKGGQPPTSSSVAGRSCCSRCRAPSPRPVRSAICRAMSTRRATSRPRAIDEVRLRRGQRCRGHGRLGQGPEDRGQSDHAGRREWRFRPRPWARARP